LFLLLLVYHRFTQPWAFEWQMDRAELSGAR